MTKKYFIPWILILALILRLININQSLWLDEAIGVLAVKDFSFWGLITEFSKFDNHPPLYYLILKLFTGLFEFSEFSIRLPSIIFGIGTIFLLSKIIKEFNIPKEETKSISFFALLFLASSQFHIYYSQEARMYSMTAFFAVLLVLIYLKFLKNPKTVNWLMLSITYILLFFTDYMGALLFPALLLIALLHRKQFRWWMAFAASFIPLFLIFILWIPIFSVQLEKGNWLLSTVPEWQNIAGGANFKQIALLWMKFSFGRITLNNKYFYYLLSIIISLPFILLFLNATRKITFLFKTMLLWFIIPIIFGLALSFFIPAFNYFRFLFILPAFYTIVSLGLVNLKGKFKQILFMSIILINLLSILIYNFNRVNLREDWKGATTFIDNKINKDDVVVFSYPEPFAPYKFYSKNKQSVGATDSILAGRKTVDNTLNIIEGKEGIYYFEYLSGLSDPNNLVRYTIERKGYVLKNIYNYKGVGFVYYYAENI